MECPARVGWSLLSSREKATSQVFLTERKGAHAHAVGLRETIWLLLNIIHPLQETLQDRIIGGMNGTLHFQIRAVFRVLMGTVAERERYVQQKVAECNQLHEIRYRTNRKSQNLS